MASVSEQDIYRQHFLIALAALTCIFLGLALVIGSDSQFAGLIAVGLGIILAIINGVACMRRTGEPH